MFDIGGGEILGLLVLAVILFGPDKLPNFAREAAGFIRKVRQFASSTNDLIKSESGTDFAREFGDVASTLRSPRRAIVESLLNSDSEESSQPTESVKSIRVDRDAP